MSSSCLVYLPVPFDDESVLGLKKSINKKQYYQCMFVLTCFTVSLSWLMVGTLMYKLRWHHNVVSILISKGQRWKTT